MAQKNFVVVGETPGGPFEVMDAINAAILALNAAGSTPASGSDTIVTIDGGLHTTRWCINYRVT